MNLRKIYILLILLSLVTVLSFADSGWLNAQSEIQKSFNANSPATNVLQNQLLGSTNTNSGFLNLNGSNVNALGSGFIVGTESTSVIISQCGTTTLLIKNDFPYQVQKYWVEKISNWPPGMRFSASYYSSKFLNLSVYIPPNLSPGTYSGSIAVYEILYYIWWGYIWEVTFEELVNLEISYTAQSYVATATSYNATFCGATGNVLTNSYKPSSNGVLLAELVVQSNSSTITINVSTAVNGGSLTPGINPSGLPDGMVLNYSNSYNASTHVLTLQPQASGASYPYLGTLDIIASNSIAQWVIPGQTVIEFQFTIVPKYN